MTVLDEATLAEARSFNEALAEVLAEQPQLHTVPPERSRRARREGRSVWPQPVFLSQARDLSVRGRSGAIRVRVLAPEEKATGVYLHIHGGGWVLGCCDEQDDLLWALVEATGLCAVSVDYRLAPEHPYPAGPDDCEDAAVWLLDRGLTELDVPDRIAIGGESAGAHLAVTTLVRLRDRHGVSGAFQAANLVYGVYDLSGTPSRRNRGDRHPMLSTPDRVWFRRSFTGDRDREELRDPDLLPAPCRAARPAAGALHRWRTRPAPRRLALHGRPLAVGRQPRRAPGLARVDPRLHGLPSRACPGCQ